MIRHAVGIGVDRMACKKRVENGHDHHELDDDRQRDLATERLLQEGGQVLFHTILLNNNGKARASSAICGR